MGAGKKAWTIFHDRCFRPLNNPMNKNERASSVLKILNRTYREVPIPLQHKNKFELLIAVLLSAQCTDERVNKVTPTLFSKANNPIKMQKVPLKTIYNIITVIL